jgi:hypothetical protein
LLVDYKIISLSLRSNCALIAQGLRSVCIVFMH